MITFLMIFGTVSALCMGSKNPSHYNYSSVALALGCFAVAAFLEVLK